MVAATNTLQEWIINALGRVGYVHWMGLSVHLGAGAGAGAWAGAWAGADSEAG